MNSVATTPGIDFLASSSRRAAAGSLLGLLIVFASLAFGTCRVLGAEKKVEALKDEVGRLTLKRDQLRSAFLERQNELDALERRTKSAKDDLDHVKDEAQALQEELKKIASRESGPDVDQAVTRMETLGTAISAASDRLEDKPLRADEGWVVIFGSDKKRAAAQHEVASATARLGLPNAHVVLRQGNYRSVSFAATREEAQKLLAIAKRHRADAYVARQSSWCPNRTKRDGIEECVASH